MYVLVLGKKLLPELASVQAMEAGSPPPYSQVATGLEYGPKHNVPQYWQHWVTPVCFASVAVLSHAGNSNPAESLHPSMTGTGDSPHRAPHLSVGVCMPQQV